MLNCDVRTGYWVFEVISAHVSAVLPFRMAKTGYFRTIRVATTAWRVLMTIVWIREATSTYPSRRRRWIKWMRRELRG